MNEFKDLKGKPPEQIPYDSKIPKELLKVEPKKNSFKVRLNLSDLFNMAWAIFSDYALMKLTGSQKAVSLGLRGIAIAIGILIVCVLLATWFL